MKAISALLLLTLFFVSCEEPVKKPASGNIKAGNFNVYYETTGEGEPLLLLHAGLQDLSMWEHQVKLLADHFQVITIDLPFHGKTAGIDTITPAYEVVKQVLDSLQIKKLHIAGLSMGASVAQDFVIAYPDRVIKAVFISAGVNGFEKMNPVDSASSVWYTKFSEALNKKDTAEAAKEFTRAWAEGIYRSEENLNSRVSKRVYKATLENLKKHKMAGWPRLNPAPVASEKIAEINVPVLILHGDKDLPYISKSSAFLNKQIKNSTILLMKNAAHMLNLEHPMDTNEIMFTFLKGKK